MRSAKIFIIFTIVLAFVICALAQSNPIPCCDDLNDIGFTDLLRAQKRIKNLKVGDQSPNELKGFEFFSEGRLKELKLGISDREKVTEIFGKDCSDGCDYGNSWVVLIRYFNSISINYFDSIKTGTVSNMPKRTLIASPDSANKIYSVKIIPKKRLSFIKVIYPDQFYKTSGVAFGHDFSGKASGMKFNSYADAYGLSYVTFDKISYTTFKEKDKRRNGDLISIEYSIPDGLEKDLFVEKK